MLLSLLLIPLLGIFIVLNIKNNVFSITYVIEDRKIDNDHSNNDPDKNIESKTTSLSTYFIDDEQKNNSDVNNSDYSSNLSESDLSTKSLTVQDGSPYLSMNDRENMLLHWNNCTQEIKNVYDQKPLYKGFLPKNSLSTYRNTIKFIGLFTSIVNLFISLLIYILFDFSTNQLQFVQDYHEISFFNLYLGIDGLSIYFVLLTTIIIPISLLSNWKSISKMIESYVVDRKSVV